MLWQTGIEPQRPTLFGCSVLPSAIDVRAARCSLHGERMDEPAWRRT